MRGPDRKPRLSPRMQRVAILVAFLVFWQIAVTLFDVPRYILPTPTEILREIAGAPLWYLDHTLRTLGATVVGFLLAFSVGCAAGIGVVYSRFIENTLYTLIIGLNSIPKIAMAPLLIIWLGPGFASKVAISFLIAFFSIVVNAVLGLRAVDPDAMDLFRSLRGSRMQTLLWLRLPNALPHLFAGAKVAIALSLVGAIAGEFVASQSGLGYVILAAQGVFDTTREFAAIVILGVAGTILFYIVDFLERLALPWHVSQRTQARAPGH
jgi:NitT/TauT family transport system permease protein